MDGYRYILHYCEGNEARMESSLWSCSGYCPQTQKERQALILHISFRRIENKNIIINSENTADILISLEKKWNWLTQTDGFLEKSVQFILNSLHVCVILVCTHCLCFTEFSKKISIEFHFIMRDDHHHHLSQFICIQAYIIVGKSHMAQCQKSLCYWQPTEHTTENGGGGGGGSGGDDDDSDDGNNMQPRN